MHSSQRRSLHCQLAFITLVLAVIPSPISLGATRPNFLFIMSDDHAAHALSAYGSVINRTPNLDRLATNGMLFTRCFVNNSICTPSRAAILTGKYSHMNGVTVFNPFDGSQAHVAKYLQSAGYQTAMIGKWHLFSDPTGFDYWNILPGQGLYNDPVMIEMGHTNKLKGYVSDIITDQTIAWLKRRDPTKPFCLMSQPKAPHREWTPSAKYTNLFADIDLPEPPTFNDDYADRSRALPEATMRMEHLRKTDLKAPVPVGLSPEGEKKWRYQRYIKDYLRCIASVDENVGRLLDYLDESGLATNTVVIYTSDQGFFLGDHGWFDKRFMYEESLRMPLLVSWPGHIRPRSTNHAMVMNIDFAPTFLELAGQPVPKDMQGRSLAPLLRGESPSDWRKSIYYRYYHYPGDHQVQPHLGVRTDRYKLIRFNKLDEWELYDLERDPRELRSVYNDPAYASTVKKLKTELARLKTELGDHDQFADELSNGEKFQPVPLELALHYDFAKANGDTVPDSSGKRPPGRVTKGGIVPGRKGRALKLDATGELLPAGQFDPSLKPFTVGAWCRPDSSNGIVLAHGGGSHGYALYIEDGVPQFALREQGRLVVARSKSKMPISEWMHLAGSMNARNEIVLWTNGVTAATASSSPISSRPRDSFVIGNDPGSRVIESETLPAWTGLLEDLRLYWGEIDPDTLDAWADR